MEFVLKLIKGDDIRRLRVVVAKITYTSLRDSIQTFYGDGDEVPVLYLDDEEELCTITTHEELLEAIRIAQSLNRPSLRLFIGSVSRYGDNGSEISSVRTFTLSDAGQLAAAMDREGVEPMGASSHNDVGDECDEAFSVTGSEESFFLVEKESVGALRESKEDVEALHQEPELTVDVAPKLEDASIVMEKSQRSDSGNLQQLFSEVFAQPAIATPVPEVEVVAVVEEAHAQEAPVAEVAPIAEEKAAVQEAEYSIKESSSPEESGASTAADSIATIVLKSEVRVTDEAFNELVVDALSASAPVLDEIVGTANLSGENEITAATEISAFVEEPVVVPEELPSVPEETLPSPPASIIEDAPVTAEDTKTASFRQLLEGENIFGAFALIPHLLQVPEVMTLINAWTQSLVNGVDAVMAFYENALQSGELVRVLEAAARAVPDFSQIKEVLVAFFESRVFQTLPPPSTTHVQVTCDKCGMRPIEGIRYKCYICRDFDLCEGCYESANETHHPLHPFVAILNNDQSIVVRHSIPHGGDGHYFPPRASFFESWGSHRVQQSHASPPPQPHWSRHHGGHHGRHGYHGHHKRSHSPDRQQRRHEDRFSGHQHVADGVLERLNKKIEKKTEKLEKKLSKLRLFGDKISKFDAPGTTSVAAPEEPIANEAPCVTAQSAPVVIEAPVQKPVAKKPEQFAGNMLAVKIGPSPSQPCAKFVSDVTVPDGEIVVAGTPFLKTWKLHNNGKSAWHDVRVISVGGNSMSGPSAVNVRPAAPGSSVEVSVPLVAPTKPGRHVGYWRLISADGTRFGDRIWVDIHVQAAEPYAVPVNTLSTADIPSAIPVTTTEDAKQEDDEYKWGPQLIQLMELELNDDIDMWRRLLDIYDGDVARTIEYYLTK